jgi:hypothetical protein
MVGRPVLLRGVQYGTVGSRGLDTMRRPCDSTRILRQAVGNLVVVTFLGHENVLLQMRGGECIERTPIATPIQSRAGGSKNNVDPHVEQKPRRTFADDWYQATFSRPEIWSAAFGTSVDAK